MSTIRFVVLVLVVILVLGVLNLGPVIAGLGLVLAAIAFAGQDFVRDYLSGLVILLENHFYVGDVIGVGQVGGTVEDFSLRTDEAPRRERERSTSSRTGRSGSRRTSRAGSAASTWTCRSRTTPTSIGDGDHR